MESLEFHGPGKGKVMDIKVKQGTLLSVGKLILTYQEEGKDMVHRFKSGKVGRVEEVLVTVNTMLQAGCEILKFRGGCSHPTIMKDMCAECGADLRKELSSSDSTANVAMVHSIPELKVSSTEAANIGLEDQERLIKGRKLVLLVDLDQTLIHTTNDNIPPNIKDVYHFQLYGPRSPWYHTRMRPRTKEFLENISHLYEFHICTFGARLYAHTIAAYLDPKGKLFSHRILSRDECFDNRSKTANMSALFPCGDNMVCIIDDREDVWNYAPNLVHVRPYHFFKHTGDINAPPGLAKQENDDKDGVDFDKLVTVKKVVGKKGGGKTAPAPPTPPDEESSSDDEPEKSRESRRESIDMPMLDSAEDGGDRTAEAKQAAEVTAGEEAKQAAEVTAGGGAKQAAEVTAGGEAKQAAEVTAGGEAKQAAEVTAGGEAKQAAEVTAGGEAKQAAEVTAGGEAKPERGVKPASVTSSGDGGDSSSKGDCEKEKPTENSHSETKTNKEEGESDTNTAEEKDDNQSLDDVNNDLEMTDDSDSDGEGGGKEKEKGVKEGKEPTVEDVVVDVEDTDDYLLYLEDILKTVHKAYYDIYDQMENSSVPDLKTVLPYVKRKVLQGVSIVFSGVVPTQVQLERSKPFLLARSLGANVSDNLDSQTTHLVAARLGTIKVNDARKRGGVCVVTPDWLWSCAERWSKVDERLFPLGKESAVTRRPPAHCSSPEIAFAERCADIDLNLDSAKYGRQPSVVEADPFLAFSTEDLEGMDREVEDILSGESDSDEEDPNQCQVGDSSEDTEDSLSGDTPRGHKRKNTAGEVGEEKRRLEAGQGELDEDEDTQDGLVEAGRYHCSASGRLPGRAAEEEEEEEDSNLEAPLVKFRRGEEIPSDFEVDGASDDEEDAGQEDWSLMGAELERELGS